MSVNNQKPSLPGTPYRLCLNGQCSSDMSILLRGWTGSTVASGQSAAPVWLMPRNRERPSGCYAVRKAMKETHYVPFTSGAPRRIRAFHTGCHIAPCRSGRMRRLAHTGVF